jgi:hypothetical protein
MFLPLGVMRLSRRRAGRLVTEMASDTRPIPEKRRAKGANFSAELADPWEISPGRKLAYRATALVVASAVGAVAGIMALAVFSHRPVSCWTQLRAQKPRVTFAGVAQVRSVPVLEFVAIRLISASSRRALTASLRQ